MKITIKTTGASEVSIDTEGLLPELEFIDDNLDREPVDVPDEDGFYTVPEKEAGR